MNKQYKNCPNPPTTEPAVIGYQACFPPTTIHNLKFMFGFATCRHRCSQAAQRKQYALLHNSKTKIKPTAKFRTRNDIYQGKT